MFAHSTCTEDGVRIAHPDADVAYLKGQSTVRYEDAKKVARYIMEYCVKNKYTICTDAFMEPNFDTDYRLYKMPNIAEYAASNYNDFSHVALYRGYFRDVQYSWK